MSFIQPHEHIIVVDYAPYYGFGLSDDDLARLRDAGVETMLGYLLWHECEPAPTRYDWEQADRLVAQARKAGMKLLLYSYDFSPIWAPRDWYLRDIRGTVHRNLWVPNPAGDVQEWSIFSFWHPDAWSYTLGFLERVRERYHAPDVLPICGGPVHGGEMLLPNTAPSYYDDRALANYRQHTGLGPGAVPDPAGRERLTFDWLRATLVPRMVEYHERLACGETWTALHHAFELWPFTGAWLIDDLYRALAGAIGGERWGFCYTVFRPSVQAPWSAQRDVQQYKVKMFVGSEGCAGLRTNTNAAIAAGYRGFVTGPLCPYLRQAKMEPWMFDAVRESLAQWKAAGQ